MSLNSPHRNIRPSKLLLSVDNTGYTSTATKYTMPSEISAASNPTVGQMQIGTVSSFTIGSQLVQIYRCLPREKVARLRLLNIDTSSNGSGATCQIGIATFPPFSGVQGSALCDGVIDALVTPTGNTMGALARGTLTFDATAFPGGTRSTEPFTLTALPGSLTGKALRPCSSISWAVRQSTNMFTDDGFAVGSLGSILVDLSFSEYLAVCLEVISDTTKTSGVLIGLETECS